MRGRTRGRRAAILAMLTMLLLGGCAGKGTAGEKPDETEGNQRDAASDFRFLEELDAGEWNDNFVDDLHAVINLSMERVTAEGELDGGATSLFAGETGGMLFKNHVFSDYGNNWSGVSGVTEKGEAISVRLETDPSRTGSQAHLMGPVSGKKGYAACYYQFQEGKPSEYWFYLLDGNFGKISGVQGRLDNNDLLKEVMGDADGNFHVTFQRTNGTGAYAIVSPDGEVIFETDLGNASDGLELRACGGGRVAVHKYAYEGGRLTDHRFYEADLEKGIVREVAASTEEAVRKRMLDAASVYYASPVSESEFAWCDRTGVFVYDAKTKKTKSVYKWSNHGIMPRRVYDGCVMADGSFGMICDGDGGGFRYLLLRPTEEKKELPSITIAASSGNKAAYDEAATYFKKLFPGYVVNVRDDWDETSLLTQLGAGEGPVLIDTELTGFEELEHLWQPLDGFLEQTGLEEELIPKALEFGKIGGVTYGIVRDFCIDTLVTADSGPDDWDYGEFLDALERCGGAAFTNEFFESPVDWREKYFETLGNGTRDNYYFDLRTGRMVFGTNDFERVLKLSVKAAGCPAYEDGKALEEGRALCEQTSLLTMAQAFRLRRRLETNGEKAIGYPTKDGARHLLIANRPLVMRSTATDEEKRIAYTFMKVYLSEDAMNSAPGLMFPVRRDVFERQVKTYETSAEVLREDGKYGYNYMPLLDRDKDVPFLEGLIENGVVRQSFSSGLQKVFDEEFGDYLAGRIDGRALDEHLKSRVWLYLEESK